MVVGGVSLVDAGAQPGSSAPEPPPVDFRAASVAALKMRAEAKDRALATIAQGDAALALAAVVDALLIWPDTELQQAKIDLIEPGVEAAVVRGREMIDRGELEEAIALLAKVRGVKFDERLTALLEEARAKALLKDGVAHEAEGRIEAARRSYLLAANLAPEDEEVRASLARVGVTLENGEARPTRQVEAADAQERAPAQPGNTTSTDVANLGIEQSQMARELDALRRQLESLDARVFRNTQDNTLTSSPAEPAVRDLDRRVDDLQRELDRFMSSMQRDIQRLERQVDSIRSRVDRLPR